MRARTPLALVKATHPGPSLAVTSVGTALGASAGVPAARCVLLAAALLTGQLSIGWCNDAVDRERDVAARRTDKPVALGTVPLQVVQVAAGSALAACVVLSLALGWRAGLTHLLAVAGGWSYDLGLKRRAVSFVPFATSFGLLPAVATLTLRPPVWPPWWAVTAGALLGVVAHLANTLPDLADDVAAGVLGLPQRLGPLRTRALSALLLAAAALVLAFAPPGPPGAAGWALLVVTALVLVAAFAVPWPHGSRTPFVLTVLAALAVVALLLARGSALA
ncbi:MAG TPA: UbiA family prenyltransferase [Actinomycetes bacterium]